MSQARHYRKHDHFTFAAFSESTVRKEHQRVLSELTVISFDTPALS